MSQRIPVVVPKRGPFVERERIQTKSGHCPICGSQLENDKCGCEEVTGYNAADRAEWLRLEAEILAEYDAADPNVPNAYVESKATYGDKFVLVNRLLEEMCDGSCEGVLLPPRRKGNAILIPMFTQFEKPQLLRYNIPDWEEFYEAQASQSQDPQATSGNLP